MIGFLYWYLLLSFYSLSNARIGVFEVEVGTEEQRQKIEEISTQLKWDVWTRIKQGKSVRFTTDSDADNVRYINSQLSQINSTLRIINENLDQSIIDEAKDNSVQRVKIGNQPLHQGGIETYFASHKEINQWLETLALQNPDIVSLNNIGKSYEGRDMLVIKLSTGTKKEAIFLDGGIHGREWLAISSVVWILNKIIREYRKGESNITNILYKFDFYFLPVTNPDGYERSRRGGRNRMWRKNTMPVSDKCYGVDLNRNFDSDFGRSEVSKDPCSDIYPGVKPFNAPETSNFRDFVINIKDRVKLSISFHSYGQLLLIPWAYTKVPTSDNLELMRVANIMVETIYNISGTVYKAGSPANILYLASGGCLDWMKEEGIKYSYTFEVRPQKGNTNKFMSPIKWIKPNGDEVYAAVIAAAKEVQ